MATGLAIRAANPFFRLVSARYERVRFPFLMNELRVATRSMSTIEPNGPGSR
jgi:hypothetical protein